MKATLLIVDDEKHSRDGLRASLDDNYDVYTAADAAGAMNILEADEVDVMVTDLRLGGDDGMKLIDRALHLPHAPICIMITAYGSVDTAVEAMKRGAYDFVTKPINIDKLEILITRALQEKNLKKENTALRQQVETKFGLEGLIGNSPALHEVVDMIKQVAPSKATVLIQGESGTGKELVAHAIHGLSNRNKGKFVAVHCAALSPSLLESELFGHERGAFTGATERRIGRFEQANGGTLFLDEIGEIDTNTQVKILRVLGEEHSFERVGGNQSIRTDVRLIAATNKSLKQLVSEGKFRDDLYYRLNVVTINMPALRERKEDIPLLVNAFLKEFAKENGKPVRELTSEAMNCIEQYDWPGNVRELRTAIERGVVMSSGAKITLRDLPMSLRQQGKADALSKNLDPARLLNLHETENRVISRALEESGGNVTEAARRLGISRRTVHRKLKELKESREQKVPDGN